MNCYAWKNSNLDKNFRRDIIQYKQLIFLLTDIKFVI